ncbi:MAG: oxygenase MpaB family protein [Cyclobacteriaceae bacterium]
MTKLSLYNSTFLDKMLQQADPLADRAVTSLFAERKGSQYRELINQLDRNDYAISDDLPEAVKTFLQESRKLPAWTDPRKIEKAHAFFKIHATTLTLMLGLLSLPYDYAGADGARVLMMSERLVKDTGRRLAETSRYVFDVGNPLAFEPLGSAIASAQKVRLIHATIRYHIHKNKQWDAALGQPINQEHMAGTNLSFSLIPIRGMRKLGIEVSQADAEAYIHLWNVANYIMGVDERLLPDTAKEAFVLDKMIAQRHFRKSEAGVQLTSALLKLFSESSSFFSAADLAPLYMRYLLGDKVADMLDIPDSKVPQNFLVNPLKSWNRILSFTQSFGNSYHTAQGLYRKNNQQFGEGKEVKMNIPSHLKGS